MKRATFLRWTPVVAALVCLGLFLVPASAQKKAAVPKKKTRVATPHELMEGLVGPNCKMLGVALKAEKTNWKAIKLKAAMLNESGHLLMADGRCPDGVWAGASKALRENSAKVFAAAKAEDLDAANAAFKALTSQGCAVCHKAHRKSKS